MKKSQYELAVQINGKPVKEYVKDGRVFVEAKSGSTYSLKIKNNSWGRILAVFSVDGIDVLNGKKASEADSGYVISAQNSVEIKGFRVNNDKEASFKFFEKGNGNGYAEVKGDASATGVIGVRIFAEKEKPKPITVKEYVPVYIDRPVYPRTPYWYDLTYSTSASDGYSTTLGDIRSQNTTTTQTAPGISSRELDMSSVTVNYCQSSIPTATKSSAKGLSANVLRSFAPSVEEKPRGFDMTTGWGDSVESKVTTVSFEKGNIVEQIEIFYASRESLSQLGIKFDSIPEVAFPSAFDSGLNFCTPPPGWRG